MTESNPYAPPKAAVADVGPAPDDTPRLNRIASGQRLLVIGVLASFAAGASRAVIGEASLWLAVLAAFIAIAGVLRLSDAQRSSTPVRVLYAVLMLVPLVNLVVMAVLSARATRALRAAGYKVGLFGAGQR